MARILVVDDEKSILEMLRYTLEAQGYLVITAETGAKALSWIKEVKLDLAIIDLGLPDMNGLEICREIKENSRTRAIPIIILTGNATNEAKIKGNLEVSADLFLNKPIENADLNKAVATILEQAEKKHMLLRNKFRK
ncbi:MAG: hypothetical protein COX65_02750 [Elusimicrobia bacterium CG_4_10_14_0_2_um_filter_56_8]|nr:MAG: hypothetical protein AUJ51_13670 [Elusimicrobia bacterium CG1_02_56_21]PJA16316.1 MAG: hypothetical protein COX65_02750 [Elusimicrobia bacterium CG_4_10_14_0_2_um_filter_56_8]